MKKRKMPQKFLLMRAKKLELKLGDEFWFY